MNSGGSSTGKDLTDQYEVAFSTWDTSEDSALWDSIVGDGIDQ